VAPFSGSLEGLTGAAMRYVTRIKGQKEAPVDVEPAGPNRFAVTLNGVRHEVDALTLRHGAVGMIIDGDSYNVEFEERGDDVAVLVRGHVSVIDVADERRLRLRAGAAQFKVEGRQLVCAPMPGKVVKFLVKPGDEVKEGQGLVVVEAMKMENELKSPKSGKVVELLAKEGTTVENNAKLVAVE
jgi:biotin carboxyl carrier protein